MRMHLRTSQTILLSAILLPVTESLQPALPDVAESRLDATKQLSPVDGKLTANERWAPEGEDLISIPGLASSNPFANSGAICQRTLADSGERASFSSMLEESGLSVRGTLRVGTGQALALIEIGRTGVHVVCEKDVLSISSGGRCASLTIVSIQRQSVEVDVGNFEDRMNSR